MMMTLMNEHLNKKSQPVWAVPSKEDMLKRPVLDRLARGVYFEQNAACPENLQLTEKNHLDYVHVETYLKNATAELAEYSLIVVADLSAPNKLLHTATLQHLQNVLASAQSHKRELDTAQEPLFVTLVVCCSEIRTDAM